MNTITPAVRELFEIAGSHRSTETSYSERALVSQTTRSGVRALTALLARHLIAFLQKANRVAEPALLLEESTHKPAVWATDEMFCLDALAADELESVGAYGADLANALRPRARERWLRGVEAPGDRKSLSTEV